MIGEFCSNEINTGNSDLAFVANGVVCKDHADKKWKNAHDPAFYMQTKRCVGYIDVNATVACVVKGFSDKNVRRLCKCVQFGEYQWNFVYRHIRIVNTGPSEVRGWRTSAPPTNLLKFVDFINEKGGDCLSRENEDWNSHIFEEATRIYQKCNIV